MLCVDRFANTACVWKDSQQSLLPSVLWGHGSDNLLVLHGETQTAVAYLCVKKHRQSLPGTNPVPVTEVILGVPSKGAVHASLQHYGMEEGQGKKQLGPGLGLLWAQCEGVWRQAAVASKQCSSHAL